MFALRFVRRQYRATNDTSDIERTRKDFRSVHEKHLDQLALSHAVAARKVSAWAAISAAASTNEIVSKV